MDENTVHKIMEGALITKQFIPVNLKIDNVF